MQIIIVGAGKLASELLHSLEIAPSHQLVSWPEKAPTAAPSVVVHAGSGRELNDAIAYCRETHSPLIELSTGSKVETEHLEFPVILCPNTNILMLKFMSMLATSGRLFQGYEIRLTESHQARKTSVPGTAVAMAQALGLSHGDIRSVRDPQEQRTALQIPKEHLERHAYHQIVIEDPVCRVTMETRVCGASPYADGVAKIISAILTNKLEDRLYRINEFIEKGWV